MPDTDAVSVEVEVLRLMLGDLDGYIERRARDVAAPMVEKAARDALDGIAEAQAEAAKARGEAQRWKDCTTELRRQLKPLDRYRQLSRLAEAVQALTRDTDGDYLPPESEIPVGEFQAAIAEALGGTNA